MEEEGQAGGGGRETLERYVQRRCIPVRSPAPPSRPRAPRPAAAPAAGTPPPPPPSPAPPSLGSGSRPPPGAPGSRGGPRFPGRPEAWGSRPGFVGAESGRRRGEKLGSVLQNSFSQADFKFGSRFEKNHMYYIRTYPHHICKHMFYILSTRPRTPSIKTKRPEHLAEPNQPRFQPSERRGPSHQLRDPRRSGGRGGGTRRRGTAGAPRPSGPPRPATRPPARNPGRALLTADRPPSPLPHPRPAEPVMRKLSCKAKYEISRRGRGRAGGRKRKM